MSRSGVPSGTSAMPWPLGVRTWTSTVPGLSLVPIARKASGPWRTIQGTAASVWTLLTTVGMPNSPRSAGWGGRCSGCPRLPSRALSRTVSSPSMYAPCTGRTVMCRSCPDARTLLPRKPASVAAPMAAATLAMTSLSSARTAMNASVAPTAYAAIARPSTTANGSRTSSVRSVCEAGSAPYPLATT